MSRRLLGFASSQLLLSSRNSEATQKQKSKNMKEVSAKCEMSWVDGALRAKRGQYVHTVKGWWEEDAAAAAACRIKCLQYVHKELCHCGLRTPPNSSVLVFSRYIMAVTVHPAVWYKRWNVGQRPHIQRNGTRLSLCEQQRRRRRGPATRYHGSAMTSTVHPAKGANREKGSALPTRAWGWHARLMERMTFIQQIAFESAK